MRAIWVLPPSPYYGQLLDSVTPPLVRCEEARGSGRLTRLAILAMGHLEHERSARRGVAATQADRGAAAAGSEHHEPLSAGGPGSRDPVAGRRPLAYR